MIHSMLHVRRCTVPCRLANLVSFGYSKGGVVVGPAIFSNLVRPFDEHLTPQSVDHCGADDARLLAGFSKVRQGLKVEVYGAPLRRGKLFTVTTNTEANTLALRLYGSKNTNDAADCSLWTEPDALA